MAENFNGQWRAITFMKDVFAYMRHCESTKAFLTFIHQNLKTQFYAENFFVALASGNKGAFTLPYYQDTKDNFSYATLSQFSDEQLCASLTSYALAQRKFVELSGEQIDELESTNVVNLLGMRPKQWLCFPLMHNDNNFGCIVVQSYRSCDEYSSHEIEILAYLSDVIATAIYFFNENIALSEALIAIERSKELLEVKVFERTKELEETLTSLKSEMAKSRKLEEQLTFDAYHDELTSLYNRKYFTEQLDIVASQANREPNKACLAYMDLDGFKTINDTYGHDCGDHVLLVTAERLKSCFRLHDVVARIGGDEFTVLLTQGVVLGDLTLLFERLIKSVSESIDYKNYTVSVGISIGIAISDQSEEIRNELLVKADKALYQAKANGKGCVELYTEEL